MQIKSTLTFKKSTKNTHVFIDESINAPVPTLYIRQQFFGASDAAPEHITITIDTGV